MIDRIADFLSDLPKGKVTPGESPSEVRRLLGSGGLPAHGTAPGDLLKETTSNLFNHSLFNGHPRFFGYITSSPAPIGALGDLLAASVNQNVGLFSLAPLAHEIEAQTIRWIAEMIGYPVDCGGILVSGGNMANFVCFLAARKAKCSWDVRKEGFSSRKLKVYASTETHTWLKKAVDLFGLGTDAISWIPTDSDLRMDSRIVSKQIREDRKNGSLPFLIIGTAGTVSTGATDPLGELAAIAREENCWYHVDGAYGALAAVLPDAPADLKWMSEADSVAVDPHKWLYAPIEAGCVLVRDPKKLQDAFRFHVPYYQSGNFEGDEAINYLEYGPQNSRGFRALKVWLGLRQVGREGYQQMISDDIALAGELFKLVQSHPELEAYTYSLSIATFRYGPPELNPSDEATGKYLNTLNEALLNRIQKSGEAYLSNAVIKGNYLLRACIVNFRTSMKDIEAVPGIVVRMGRKLDTELRPNSLHISPRTTPR